MIFADDVCRWYFTMIFAGDIWWWCELIVRVPPGPENEAGRPNSYGQPQVIDDHYDQYDDHYDQYYDHYDQYDHYYDYDDQYGNYDDYSDND